MKYARFCVLVLLLCSLLTGSAFAEEFSLLDPEETPVETPEETPPADSSVEQPDSVVSDTAEDGGNIIVNVTLPAVSADDPVDSAAEAMEEDPFLYEDPEQIQLVTLYSDASLDTPVLYAEDIPSISAAVEALFGTYTPRTQTVTDYLSDGSSVTYTQVIPGAAGLDWDWLACVGLFALFFYCVLRMIGGLLKR